MALDRVRPRNASLFSSHYLGGEYLDLSNQDLNDNDVGELINFLDRHPRITSLYLNNNRIGNKGAGLLANRNLRSLSLNNNLIGNEGAKLLAKSNIQLLSLMSCRINNDGVNLFLLNTSLRSLRLENNAISAMHLKYLNDYIARQHALPEAEIQRIFHFQEKSRWRRFRASLARFGAAIARGWKSFRALTVWDKIIGIASGLSEASNIGIVISIISKWCQSILTAAGGFFSALIFYADPLIYCFKSLIRLTRIVARSVFNVKLDEEKIGQHKHQTAADIASLALFSFSIVLFLGLLVAPPIGVTVAWCLALSGLSIIGHFDYAHQEKLAKERYEHLKHDLSPNASPEDRKQLQKALDDYNTKRTSKRLFYGLLIGLTLLLVCGSAAVFAPPALAPILYVVSKIASAYLAGIAIGRFGNWALPAKWKEALAKPFVKCFRWIKSCFCSNRETAEAVMAQRQEYANAIVESPIATTSTTPISLEQLPLLDEFEHKQGESNQRRSPVTIEMNSTESCVAVAEQPTSSGILTSCRATHFYRAEPQDDLAMLKRPTLARQNSF